MSSIPFSQLKVTDLQEYLKARGITISKINRPKLVELCNAVSELDLPIDPDMIADKALSPAEQLRAELGIEDPFTLQTFSKDLSSIPSFSLFDLFNYLINKTTNCDRRKLKAYKSCEDYRLYFDGHVESLEYTEVPMHDVIIFRAKVKPTQKDKTYLNKTTYDLWVVMGKKNADIKMAYCTCIGG